MPGPNGDFSRVVVDGVEAAEAVGDEPNLAVASALDAVADAVATDETGAAAVPVGVVDVFEVAPPDTVPRPPLVPFGAPAVPVMRLGDVYRDNAAADVDTAVTVGEVPVAALAPTDTVAAALLVGALLAARPGDDDNAPDAALGRLDDAAGASAVKSMVAVRTGLPLAAAAVGDVEAATPPPLTLARPRGDVVLAPAPFAGVAAVALAAAGVDAPAALGDGLLADARGDGDGLTAAAAADGVVPGDWPFPAPALAATPA